MKITVKKQKPLKIILENKRNLIPAEKSFPAPQDSDVEGYKVGYKNPPLFSRFAKGISGNPNGRPKGDKNSSSILKDILAKEVTVKRNGQPSRVNTTVAIWLQLVNRALSGDLKAISMVLSQVSGLEMKEEEKEKVFSALKREDKFIIENFMERNKDNPSENK